MASCAEGSESSRGASTESCLAARLVRGVQDMTSGRRDLARLIIIVFDNTFPSSPVELGIYHLIQSILALCRVRAQALRRLKHRSPERPFMIRQLIITEPNP